MTDRERRAVNLPTLGQIRTLLVDIGAQCERMHPSRADFHRNHPAARVWVAIGYLDKVIEHEQMRARISGASKS